MINKIICFLKGHSRGLTDCKEDYDGSRYWTITCKRCGHTVTYKSRRARLVGTELKLGFDGK